MANSVIIDNSAYYGGGVFAAYNGTVSMDSCTVEKNRALVGGGGFHLKGSTAELTQCVVPGPTSKSVSLYHAANARGYYTRQGLMKP